MKLLDLIGMLSSEVAASRADLLVQASRLVQLDETHDTESLEFAAQTYADFCHRTAAASDSLALTGLSVVASALGDGVLMAAALPQELRGPAEPLLKRWPDFLAGYLGDWAAGTVSKNAVDLLLADIAAAEFVTPLDEVQRTELGARLMAPPSLEDQQAAMQAPWEPLADDALRLVATEDADPMAMEGLLTDGPALAQRLSEVVEQLIAGQVPPDRLELAHRTAHTLKGTAAIAGVRGVATLAHSLEDVMEMFRNAEFCAPDGLVDAMVRACDQMEMVFDHVQNQSEAPASFVAAARILHGWACHLQGAEVPESMLEVDAVSTMTARRRIEAGADTGNSQHDPGPAPELSAATTEADAQIRVPVRALDRIFRAVNELSIGILRLRRQGDDILARTDALATLEQAAVQRLLDIERRVHLEGLGRHATGGAAARGLQRPDAEGETFDALELDRYNELAGAAQALNEAILDLRTARQDLLPAMRESTALLQRQLEFAREAQYQMAQARLRPLSDLRTRLRRIVRQTCSAVGREALLEIVGDDLRVDAAVLGPLSDALLHLLRNAIDHGIESPQERQALGKPESGVLRLVFEGAGGGVVVRLSDDGRGLDHEGILDKAIWKGLIAPDAELTHEQIGRLIFLPGFSTRSAVTETSGRGVGLDVVAEAVASMQGDVRVKSEPGKGTEFRLFVLASVGAVHALHVCVGTEHYLVPSIQLQQAEAADSSAEVQDDTVRLQQLLHGNTSSTGATAVASPALLLDVDGKRVRVLVDRILEAREFLIAPPPKLIDRMPGVSGVSALANGAMAIVLDLPDLARKPVPVALQGLRQMQAAVAHQLKVLVVDDSPSVRNTLSSLLQDAGYGVATARDGLDAIHAIRDSHFLAVLTDLEMPQVNGFELTEFIRQRSSQPALPVVMLTSRGQDKHRARATEAGVDRFLVKPYADQHLLDALRQAINRESPAPNATTTGVVPVHTSTLESIS